MSIANNLKQIKHHINIAAKQSHRNNQDITLIAVSKYHSADNIIEAIQSGHTVFAENRVQEALEKWPAIKQRFPDTQLHLIGPLQRNKVKDALKIFDVIQTVDRPSLKDQILKELKKNPTHVKFFIQVNIGAEKQKSGIAPDEADSFIDTCANSALKAEGLMCIPPANEPPEEYFKQLKTIASKHHLNQLSMGMSADFETAIRCGATHVRIGTAIFGPRK